ncbi:MAG: 23S rRNA (adenine(2503)-C(2))-methyltransferase RlmN [Planctomycetota bacterium]|nr:MAG: 23S rRNA (adenine(2503)-C(2))-methyltransferase RlmN [Planctomycetota bacterium]
MNNIIDGLIGYSKDQWQELMELLDEKSFRSGQLKEWIFEKGVDDFSNMTNISETLKNKLENYPILLGQVVFEAISKDGTYKLLVRYDDGQQVECVMIPTASRITYCISSQVGCAMGCRFCATGKLGIKRNLTAGEILSQVFLLKKITGQLPNNIVYMGMGEPFMNYDNVIQSARIMNDPAGFGIGARKITISTVGVPHVIKQYADEAEQFHLAISLHASNDAVRDSIVPVNDNWQMSKIIEAARYFNQKTNRIVTFEYVLLAGVNDLKEHAQELRKLIDFPAKLNLIPFNDHKDSEFKAPTSSRVQFFKNSLEKLGLVATIRSSRGQDIAAACGQLAKEKIGGLNS